MATRKDIESQQYIAVDPNLHEHARRVQAEMPERPHAPWRPVWMALGAAALVLAVFGAAAVALGGRSRVTALLRYPVGQKPEGKQLLAYPVAAAPEAAAVGDVDAWQQVLQAHVSPAMREGFSIHEVDYAGVKADPLFQQFVQSLELVDVASLDKDSFYAVLMNAYNAFAIKMVIDNSCGAAANQCSPLASIGDIAGVWGKPAGNIGGTMYSLQQIEDMLRKPTQYQEDSRLHMCITCASLSCPNLPLAAFRPDTVESLMDMQARSLLSNSQKGFLLDRVNMVLTLSKVFSMYRADFEQSAGSLIDWVLPYIDAAEDRAFLETNKLSITVSFFDWNRNLNGVAPCDCQAAAPNLRFQ